ncbi:MAG TPA: gamma-butyrobetaine hydroxylase-like domain-containing protein, partial [Anaerolineales bacterium]
MNNLRPTSIKANRQTGEFQIVWNDGHQSAYSFSLLRHACPCAECRGGHERMSATPDPEVFGQPLEDTPATRLRKIQPGGGKTSQVCHPRPCAQAGEVRMIR